MSAPALTDEVAAQVSEHRKWLDQVVPTLIIAAQIDQPSPRIATELGELDRQPPADEKTRQEVRDLRIKNEVRGLRPTIR